MQRLSQAAADGGAPKLAVRASAAKRLACSCCRPRSSARSARIAPRLPKGSHAVHQALCSVYAREQFVARTYHYGSC